MYSWATWHDQICIQLCHPFKRHRKTNMQTHGQEHKHVDGMIGTRVRMSHSCSGNTISSQLTPPEMLMKRLSIVWPKEPKYRFASSSCSSPSGGFLTAGAVQFREHFPNSTLSLPWPHIATEARRVKQVVVDSLSQEHRKHVDLSKHVVRGFKPGPTHQRSFHMYWSPSGSSDLLDHQG